MAVYAPDVNPLHVQLSGPLNYSFIVLFLSRGVLLHSLFVLLFFFVKISVAQPQLEIFLAETSQAEISQAEKTVEPDACNVKAIRQLQRNAPGQLIKITSDSTPVHLIEKTARQYRYKIIRRLPHNTAAFTQGLTFYNGFLYEGTGLLGKSEIRQLEANTGKLIKSRKTDALIFGEGISIRRNHLVQISWKSERAHIYDTKTLNLLKELKYKGEGWGVTHIGDKMLISNGSSLLQWHNAENLADTGIDEGIRVTASGIELQGINELEYANGFIYANVWPTDCIAEIDPGTGNVNAWIDLTDLYPAPLRTDWNAVSNGIAYQPDKNVFYVTGKYWPYIYVISLQLPEKDA